MKAIVSNEFKTELGIIRTWIESDRDIVIQNSCIQNNQYEQNTSIATAHKITLETFELSNK